MQFLKTGIKSLIFLVADGLHMEKNKEKRDSSTNIFHGKK